MHGFAEETIAALEARGIDVELASRLGWRSDRRGAITWLRIPYCRDGREVNFKDRTLSGEKRFAMKPGGEMLLYNFDILAENSDAPLILTEGEMDCIIALQCGYQAVSVPSGAPSEKVQDGTTKYAFLEPLLKGGRKIILAVDDDTAGANLLHDISIRIGKHRCKWVKYPDGCKDLNETLLKHGAAAVRDTIDGAEFMKVDGVYRMSDLPPVIEHPALWCGIAGTEDHIKLRRGDLSVITGIPGHGKSTLLNEMAFNMIQQHGWNVAFASFEQKPQIDHKRSLRNIFNGLPEFRQSLPEKKAADEWIDKHLSFICPNEDDEVTLGWCLEKCAAAVMQYNADWIVIDPWNEMDHEYDRSQTLTQYTGFAIKQFRKFAAKHAVHVTVAVHPAKMQKHKDTGKYPIPTLYDISDSAHWYNKTDLGIVVHRDGADTIIRIAKSRYHSIIGRPGDVMVKYDDYRHRYEKIEAPSGFDRPGKNKAAKA